MDTCIQNTLKYNSRNSPVKYLNQAISKPGNKINSFTGQEEFTTVTFKQFLRNNNISYIDFLKIMQKEQSMIFSPVRTSTS